MQAGLGKMYSDGEIIVRQGEMGDCMFVIQSGTVEVSHGENGKEMQLAILGPGDMFGEMALFEREVRSGTVRALKEARVLTVDKRIFLQRVHEDPSLAWRVSEQLSRRIRNMNSELHRLRAAKADKPASSDGDRIPMTAATDRGNSQ